jgi:hypothetical protein
MGSARREAGLKTGADEGSHMADRSTPLDGQTATGSGPTVGGLRLPKVLKNVI